MNGRRWIIPVVGFLLLVSSAGCSRSCPKCNGATTVVVLESCERCSGTGTVIERCPTCKGAGKAMRSGACSYCGGRGSKVCTYKKSVTVPGNTCYIPSRKTYGLPSILVVCKNGRLEAENPADAPKYASLDQDNPNRICPACYGAGVVQCSVCQGRGVFSGEFLCETCNGTGHLVASCPGCAGERVVKRRIPCPLCKGKGTLSRLFN